MNNSPMHVDDMELAALIAEARRLRAKEIVRLSGALSALPGRVVARLKRVFEPAGSGRPLSA